MRGAFAEPTGPPGAAARPTDARGDPADAGAAPTDARGEFTDAGAAPTDARGERADARAEREAGSALLMAIGAAAALALVVAGLLTTLLGAQEAVRYRLQRRQAQELARAALREAALALAQGSLPWPEPGRSESVRNGVRLADGSAVPVAMFPRPPTGAGSDPPGGARPPPATVPAGEPPPWPATTGAAWIDGRPSGGVGAQVSVSVVTGPDGRARGATARPDGSRLYELCARAWFRRASAQARARLLRRPDGTALLLR